MKQLFRSPKPAVGLVIGTFAAVPYIHLQLESRKRFYPDVPLLVHDDCSPLREALISLCQEYEVELVSTPERLPHCVGDLSSYVSGFRWCQKRRLDMLVKFSRRFIPLYPWVETLQRLAFALQYPTYSSSCVGFGFGFRTECVAFHVPTWIDGGGCRQIELLVQRKEGVFVEGFIHNLAREMNREHGCRQNADLEKFAPRAQHVSGYGDWWIGGVSRLIKDPEVLWHDCNSPQDYASVARHFGLPYGVEDFQDPNAGYGIGPAR